MSPETPDTTAGTTIPATATAATTAPSLPAEPTGQGTAAGTPEDADLAEAFSKMEELTRGPIFHSGELLGPPGRFFLDQLPVDDAEALEVIDRSSKKYKTMMLDYLLSVDDAEVDTERRRARDALDAKRKQSKTDAIRELQAERRRILAAGMSEADTRAAIKAANAAATQRTNDSLQTVCRQRKEEDETMNAERQKAREAFYSSPRGIAMRQHAEELARAPVERWRGAAVAWLETDERREAVAKKRAAGDGGWLWFLGRRW